MCIKYTVLVFFSQTEYDEGETVQFDVSAGTGDETSLTGRGLNSGGKTRDEQPGEDTVILKL